MQLGWTWLDYLKAGEVLAKEEVNKEHNANWADVRINFTATDSNVSGAYQARVEVCSQVMSAFNSTKQMELQAVKQYYVSRLVKV